MDLRLGAGRKEVDVSTSTNQMSATEALDFRHFSVRNAVQAQLACPEAYCEAYRDILTRRRWRAWLRDSQGRAGPFP
jgi:hypothetical protein